jgi:quinol monooxygenase YgiN
MNSSITVIARFAPKEGMDSEVEGILKGMVPPTRREAGCLHYDLYRTTETPSAFLLFERYRDSEALDEHRKTEHYKNYRAVIANLLKDPIQVSVLQFIDVLNQSSQGTPLL